MFACDHSAPSVSLSGKPAVENVPKTEFLSTLSRSSSEFKTFGRNGSKQSDIMTTDFQSVWLIHCHVPADSPADLNIPVFPVINYWIALSGAHWRPFWQTSHFMHSHWLAWRPFVKDNAFLMSIKHLTGNPLTVVLTQNPNTVFTVSYSILPSFFIRWNVSHGFLTPMNPLTAAGPCFNCLTRVHCFEMHWITAVGCPGEVRLTFTGHDYHWQGGLGLCVCPIGDGWTRAVQQQCL